jgi:hypothetical protein
LIQQRGIQFSDSSQNSSFARQFFRISSPIKPAEFKRLPQQDRKKLGNDYVYAAFEACIEGALLTPVGFGQIDALQLIYDLAEQYSEKCVKLFNELRRQKPEVKERCAGISFMDDEVYPGVQAADLVACCSRASATRDTNPPEPIVDEIVKKLEGQQQIKKTVLYNLQAGGLGTGTIES